MEFSPSFFSSPPNPVLSPAFPSPIPSPPHPDLFTRPLDIPQTSLAPPLVLPTLKVYGVTSCHTIMDFISRNLVDFHQQSSCASFYFKIFAPWATGDTSRKGSPGWETAEFRGCA